MTPTERHHDAVEAAREWRDEQRATPRRGDKIRIIWPGGPHDFDMVFEDLDESMPQIPGWLWLRGSVGVTSWMGMPSHDWRTIYARPTDEPGVYRMVETRTK